MTAIDDALFTELRASLDGDVVAPDDPVYEEARKVFNGMIDKHPAAIARCAGPADVATAIKLACDRGVPLAVRCGGHSVAGLGICDGGIVDRPVLDEVDEVDCESRDRTRRGRGALGGVRSGDASARSGHSRRPDDDHRTGRLHAGRRLRLAVGQVRACLRQPDRSRRRDRGRSATDRLRDRERRPAVGSSRRRRQFRRSDVLHVPAPPARPDPARRSRAVAHRAGARCDPGLARLRRRRSRRGVLSLRPAHGAAGPVRALASAREGFAWGCPFATSAIPRRERG